MISVIVSSLCDTDLIHDLQMVSLFDVGKLFPVLFIGRLNKDIQTFSIAGMSLDLFRSDIGPAVFSCPIIFFFLAHIGLIIGTVFGINQIVGMRFVVTQITGIGIDHVSSDPVAVFRFKVFCDVQDHLTVVIIQTDTGIGKDAGSAQIDADDRTIGTDRPVDRCLSYGNILHLLCFLSSMILTNSFAAQDRSRSGLASIEICL